MHDNSSLCTIEHTYKHSGQREKSNYIKHIKEKKKERLIIQQHPEDFCSFGALRSGGAGVGFNCTPVSAAFKSTLMENKISNGIV